MPVKLRSKLVDANHEARIEIIPLIDIMFFLLAAFMLVSLSMVNLRAMPVSLPAAGTSDTNTPRKDTIGVSVDANGGTYVDRRPVADNELARALTEAKRANPNLTVIISGDAEARHGSMIHVLDVLRASGIDQVAFETRPASVAKP